LTALPIVGGDFLESHHETDSAAVRRLKEISPATETDLGVERLSLSLAAIGKGGNPPSLPGRRRLIFYRGRR